MPEGKWTQTDWNTCLRDAAKTALIGIGIMIEGDAKLLAPVLTGRLAGSITYATRSKKSSVRTPAVADDAVDTPANEWTLHVGTNVEYAPHMEYGAPARNIPAQPYLRPALDRRRGDAQGYFGKQIAAAIRKHGK